jgi:hypothetical protein
MLIGSLCGQSLRSDWEIVGYWICAVQDSQVMEVMEMRIIVRTIHVVIHPRLYRFFPSMYLETM